VNCLESQKEWIQIENQGEKISAVLHKPLNTLGKAPAVAIFHGFGGTKSGKHRLYVKMADRLAAMGAYVLRIDYRGSGDSEGCFSEKVIDDHLSDAMLSIKFLEEIENVDSNRIGILGRSYGGIVSILAAAKKGNIKTIALWAPVFYAKPWLSLLEEFQANPDFDPSEPVYFIGEETNPLFVQQFFTLDLSQEMPNLENTSLFVAHGVQDELVGIEHMQQYKLSRNAAKAESLFLELENSNHDFDEPHEQKQLQDDTFSWFQKTL
jgi:dipeptidyl aminopeptidase/acylaminoacyl peptidase